MARVLWEKNKKKILQCEGYHFTGPISFPFFTDHLSSLFHYSSSQTTINIFRRPNICHRPKGTVMGNMWCLILGQPKFDVKIKNKHSQNKYRNTNNVDMRKIHKKGESSCNHEVGYENIHLVSVIYICCNRRVGFSHAKK